MKTLLLAIATGVGLAAPAWAVQPDHDPNHDHRHGARTASPGRPADPPHLGLLQAAQYISAQVPGEIRHVESHPGGSIYTVDMDLVNGARAGFEVDAHNGTVRWHEIPVARD